MLGKRKKFEITRVDTNQSKLQNKKNPAYKYWIFRIRLSPAQYNFSAKNEKKKLCLKMIYKKNQHKALSWFKIKRIYVRQYIKIFLNIQKIKF